MEKRTLKVYFGKSGNGTGTTLRLPITLLRKIGVTQENREITLIYDDEKKALIITKED